MPSEERAQRSTVFELSTVTATTAEMLRSVMFRFSVLGNTRSTETLFTHGLAASLVAMPFASTLSKVEPAGTAANSVSSSPERWSAPETVTCSTANAPEFESTNPPMPNTPSSTAMVTKTPITFRDEPVRALLYREALRTSETLTERKSPSRYPLPCR